MLMDASKYGRKACISLKYQLFHWSSGFDTACQSTTSLPNKLRWLCTQLYCLPAMQPCSILWKAVCDFPVWLYGSNPLSSATLIPFTLFPCLQFIKWSEEPNYLQILLVRAQINFIAWITFMGLQPLVLSTASVFHDYYIHMTGLLHDDSCTLLNCTAYHLITIQWESKHTSTLIVKSVS